jgi:thiol-disulfide isomerase/thioredoxin
MSGQRILSVTRLPGFLLFLVVSTGFAQDPPKDPPKPPPTAAEIEEKDLSDAVADANNSPVDLIRLLEDFLKKHPQASSRLRVEQALAQSAIDAHDDRRTVIYGQRALAADPSNLLMLDRVARALLALGGKANAETALKYSRAFADAVTQAAPPAGREIARKQDERDRGMARALLFQARAKAILADHEEAGRLAGQSFNVYPSEEAAREWSNALEKSGRMEDALARLADAFVIPDAHSADANHADDRRKLGEMYLKVRGSYAGLGELILAAYDRTTALQNDRQARLRKLDANWGAAEATQFTLTGLDGSKLALASLKGKVIVLDFWATWCQPCRIQHPMYEQVKQRFKDRSDVVFLAVDTDEDRELVAPFLEKQNWSKAVYFEDGLQRLLQVGSIPTTMLLDKQGRVASRMAGFLPDQFVNQLTSRIVAALGE